MSDDNLIVGTKAKSVASSPVSHATVSNAGPTTVYYKDEANVTTESYDGALAKGASATFTDGPRWFISSGAGARLFVSYSPEATTDMATQAELDAVSGSLAAVFNVKAYGAIGDGTTDDTASIQEAIDAANPNGTVWFPEGEYLCTSSLNCDQTQGLRMTGPGGWKQYNVGDPTILYSAKTGNLIEARSALSFELDHLRLRHTHAEFSGNLVNLDGNALAEDCQLWQIHDCAFSGKTSTVSEANVKLNKAIIGSIRRCHFASAKYPLKIGNAGGSYVVSASVEDCTFNFASEAHVFLGSADLESLTIARCTFEAGTNTTAIKGENCALYSPAIEDCWFGDASGKTNWITGIDTVSGNNAGIIKGCRFSTPGEGTHVAGTGHWLVTGCTFESGVALDFATSTLVLIGNAFNNVEKIFSGNRPTELTAIGNISPTSGGETTVLRDTLRPRMSVGQRGGGEGGSLAAGPTDGTEQVVLGSTTATTLQALGEKAGLYTYYAGGNLFAFVIQAPTFAGAREIQIATGTEPVPVFRAADKKLGFFNTAPQARPNIKPAGEATTTEIAEALYTLGLVE